MDQTKAPQPGDPRPEEIVRDIRSIMEKSSRFISLSGLSGIAAGITALAGAWLAANILANYYGGYQSRGFFSNDDFSQLKIKLLSLAVGVFVVAALSAFYFTWLRAKRSGVSIWGPTSKRLFWNMVLPLLSGGAFVIGMLRYDEWRFVAPSCLIFYGLALVNASKFTLTDVRYLGYCEVLLGLANMFFIGYGLYFWALGFGVLHIVYGAAMWVKYEKNG